MDGGAPARRAAPAGTPIRLLGGRVRWTGRREGDLRPGDAPGALRWPALVDRPVAWLRQVHGNGVAVVGGSRPVAGVPGDALVTASPAVALAVLTADCAPVALASPEGVVGAVHAGWAGLVAGVVEEAVGAMRRLGAGEVVAALGPCIRAECYAFGHEDLDRVAARLGAGVRSVTASGGPALDLPAAVAAALGAAGADLVHDEAVCTACAASACFSHRARREVERQAMVVWRAS